MTKSSSKETVEGKLGVGSKKDARSRRVEILHSLGKSTTESDVTEGFDKFCILIYRTILLFVRHFLSLANVNSSFRKLIVNFHMFGESET